MDTWDGIPEARAFCEDVVSNIDRYKLFPGEAFADFTIGVFASTETDAHGESFSLESLNSVAEHISNRRLWAGMMHDPTIQPSGRTIAAKVFQSTQTGQHILAGVVGRYAAANLPTFSDVGIDPSDGGGREADCPPQSVEPFTTPVLGFDPNDFEEDLINAALKDVPSQLEIGTERHFRKALEPLSIITVTVSLAAISKIAFLDELQKEAVKALFSWLKGSLFPRICRPRRTMFEFASPYNGCHVQFVVRGSTPATLSEAAERFEEGARAATSLLDRFGSFGFDKLVYEYDEEAKKWLPLHAATTKFGVISNRPQLIAMDRLTGFSLSGASHRGPVLANTSPPTNAALRKDKGD